LSKLQQSIDQLCEMKRGDGWEQHTGAADARHISADRAETTLKVLGELNFNMRSEIGKQGARVDLRKQIQFMRRMLDTKRQTEQAAPAMRQGKPEDTGIKPEHRQKNLKCGGEQVTARQTSRRHKLLMRRLWHDERQHERAQRGLRNIISQVHGQQAEHTAEQREEQREQHRAEQGSSRVHCESGKYSHDMSNSDKRRVRNAEIADSGEAMPYEHNPADTRGSQEGMASSKQACLRLELHVEKVCAYWWTVGTYWLQYAIVVGAMYTIAICWDKIEE